jgi:hypothetical protein
MALTKATLIDLNSNELVLDLDADTSITADTDDTIHFKIAGSDEITMTAGAIAPSTSDGNALGTTSLMFSDLFLASGSVVNFNNGDVTLTHSSNTVTLAGGTLTLPDSGLVLNSTAVTSTAAEINLIDGGTSTGTTAVADADGIITNDGGTMRLTTAATFKTYFQEGISQAYDDFTIGDAAVLITTSSGNITIDAAANDSDIILKGTDGGVDTTFLTIDGSAAGTAIFNNDVTVGDNLNLTTDSSVINFGANSEITLTHVHDAGLALKHTATADDKPIRLVLQTGEVDMAANDVIGAIDFQAPNENTGTDAILVAASIEAVSEGDFSSTANATSLVFKTGASEAAAAKLKLTSAGHLLPATDDTHDLGSASFQWRNIYTGDLHLSNESKAEGNIVDGTTGNWTIQEGAEELYILNNKSGKKYKFNLTEV